MLTVGCRHEVPEALGRGLAFQPLLTELLAALLGFPGDVFSKQDFDSGIEDEEDYFPHPDKCDLSVSSDIAWIDGPLRVELEELLCLGYHYTAIRKFVDAEGTADLPANTQPSAYRSALAAGLDELLEVYRIAVHQIQCLEAVPVLAHVKRHLSEFMDLLPALHRLVFDVQMSSAFSSIHSLFHPSGVGGGTINVAAPASSTSTSTSTSAAPLRSPAATKGFSGAALIARLHSATVLGGETVARSCMLRLLWHCNQVLFKQLTSWMVHGMLVDPHNEFFIASNPSMANGGTGAAAAAAKVSASAASAGIGVGTGTGGTTANRRGTISSSSASPSQAYPSDEQASYAEWHEGFQLRAELVPLYISEDAAAAICFIGKAVRVLKQPLGRFKGHELLPLQDTIEFAQALQRLAVEPVFSRSAFEQTVEAIRAKVAALLWHLVVERAGLAAHLAAIKDYYLMAAGDLWREFLEAAQPAFAQPPHPSTANSQLAAALAAAALRSNAEHDRLFGALRLSLLLGSDQDKDRLMLSGANGKHSLPCFDPSWDPMLLEYRLEWPLGLMLTQDQLRRYNLLFNLLLRLKRTHLALDQAWTALKRVGHARDPAIRAVVELRRHMAHVIANLQVYIQSDVVETNFAVLEARISAAQDYAQVEAAHAMYLHTLMDQTFLSIRNICEQLGKVFSDAKVFCQLVSNAVEDAAASAILTLPGASSSSSRAPAASVGPSIGRSSELPLDIRRISALQAEYDRDVSLLYTNFASNRLLDSFRAPHLRQLILRLDYNGQLLNKPNFNRYAISSQQDSLQGR